MVKRCSNDQTENMEKVDQNGVYKINCGQCDSVHIWKTGRKFRTRMKEHTQSRAKKDDKSLLGKHRNDEGNFSNAQQKFKALHKENFISTRKLKERLEIVRAKKDGKQKHHLQHNFI